MRSEPVNYSSPRIKYAIRIERERRGLSDSELAAKAGITINDLLALESEKHGIDLVKLCAVAKSLGVSLAELLSLSVSIDDIQRHKESA